MRCVCGWGWVGVRIEGGRGVEGGRERETTVGLFLILNSYRQGP